MKRVISFFAVILALFAYSLSTVYADGANNSSLSIHTTVLNPQTNSYVDSLSLTDPMYAPSDSVVFHITIKNDGQSTVSMANVDNTLPDYVIFESGAGNLNANRKVLSFSLTNSAPNTTRSYAVLGKIADAQVLPTNQGVVCVADKAVLKTTDGKSVQSSSSFCIQKGIQPSSQKVFPADSSLKKTPPTGPEALGFISIFSTGLAGMVIRRFAKRK